MFRHYKKVFSLLLASGMMLTTAQPTYASNATVITIDPRIQYQTLEGWGTSLCWWANACGNWTDTTKKDELLDIIFGEEGLGLNIVRYNIGGSENPAHDHMRAGGEVPGYLVTPGEYDWTADAGQRYMLQGAIDRGANITEAFLNSPPYWMTDSQCTSGSATGLTDNLYSDHYDDFADYITEVLKHFRDEWGVDFGTISPINEPSTPFAWPAGGGQEGCHYTVANQDKMIKALAESLEAKGLSTEISGPEETFIDWAMTTYNGLSNTAREQLKQINVHTYQGSQRAQAKALAFGENKRLWMSETGVGGGNVHDHNAMDMSMELASRLIMDMKYVQSPAWVYWQVVEDEANQSNWGMIHANFAGENDFYLSKGYYSFAQFTKFIRPGYQFIGSNAGSTSNNNVIAAYDEANNQAVFVVMNGTGAAVDYAFDLTRFASTGSVNVYRTSPTENLEQLEDTQTTDGYINTSIPAKSVTTYVVNDAFPANDRIINDTEVGEGHNEMNFVGDWNYSFDNGCWDFDNHYTWTADSYVTIPFTGTGFAVYGSKDLKFGKFAVSVDGQPETVVDCYSVVRKNNQLLYQLDNLEQGDHTIKIRVTGKKNALATAATVNVDRVDVFEQVVQANIAEPEISSPPVPVP